MKYSKSREMLPAYNMTINLPKNFSPTEVFYETVRKAKNEIHPLFYYIFTSGISVSQLGIVFDKLTVFSESDISVRHKNRTPFRIKHLAANYLKKKIELPREEHYIVAHDTNYQAYYHWLLETLPRLFAAKDLLKEKILLVPSNLTHFHNATLELFNFKDIYLIKPDEYVRIQSLTLIPHVASKARFQASLITEMREYILKKTLGEKGVAAERRVFISRKKSGKRFLLNEPEIQDIVKEYGFDIICLEDLSWKEQVMLFADTRLLVTTHGAALANTLFMPFGSSFLEFRSSTQEHFGLSYYKLSSCLDISYYYQMCTPDLPHDYIRTNLTVDVQLLEHNLQLMINHNESIENS